MPGYTRWAQLWGGLLHLVGRVHEAVPDGQALELEHGGLDAGHRPPRNGAGVLQGRHRGPCRILHLQDVVPCDTAGAGGSALGLACWVLPGLMLR